MKLTPIRMWHVVIICISAYIGLLPNSSMAMNEYPSLKMHGEIYQNSCSPEQKKMLRGRLSKSGVPDEGLAWQTIELVLCASNSQINRRKVVVSFNEKVTEKTESTAGKAVYKTIRPNEELAASIMAVGEAWDTSILIEGEKIILQYFVSEACVNSATLLRNNSNWLIYEIGQACD